VSRLKEAVPGALGVPAGSRMKELAMQKKAIFNTYTDPDEAFAGRGGQSFMGDAAPLAFTSGRPDWPGGASAADNGMKGVAAQTSPTGRGGWRCAGDEQRQVRTNTRLPQWTTLLTSLMTLGMFALTVLFWQHRVSYPFFYIAAAVMSVAVAYAVLRFVLRSHLPDSMTAGAMWRVSVITVIFLLGLPVILVVLATSGGSRSAVIGMFSGQQLPWGPLESLCLWGIPVLLVIGPEYLRIRGRAAAASSLVPPWLAGFASVLTAIYIVLLHFGEPQKAGLDKLPLGIWSVAALGVAVLLAPFYRIVVKGCLQQGIAVAFDPGRWWSAWCVAYRAMRSTPAVAAEGQQKKGMSRGYPGATDGARSPSGGQGAWWTREQPNYRPGHHERRAP
jgi:hypothetical protein